MLDTFPSRGRLAGDRKGRPYGVGWGYGAAGRFRIIPYGRSFANLSIKAAMAPSSQGQSVTCSGRFT